MYAPSEEGGKGHKTHLLRLSSPLRNPRLCLIPCFIQGEEACLSATLDELIWLRNELGVEDPAWELGVRSDGVCRGIP